MRSPVGDHWYLPTLFSASLSCRASPPNNGIIHTCDFALSPSPRLLIKLRCSPSGENAGALAEKSPRVYWVSREPSAAAIQMWVWNSESLPSINGVFTTYAIYSPSGEVAVP